MMVDPFQNFADVSLDEWKDKIVSFLKGKSLDSLHHQFTDEIILDPIVRPQTLTSSQIMPQFSNNNQWMMAETFIVGEQIETCKEQILSGLEYGVNYVHLHLDHEHTFETYSTFFEGIYLNMIHVHFTGHISDGLVRCLEALSLQYEQAISLSFPALSKLSQATWPSKDKIFSNSIWIKEQGIDSLCQAISDCNQHIENCLSNKKKQCSDLVINIILSDSFYMNMAIIKACKRLWLALLEAHGRSTYEMPMLVVQTTNKTNDMFHQMISNSAQAISAIIEGVDAVMVKTEKTEDPTTATRIGRNIHHILREESYLAQIVDATSGAYLIEDLSQQLITKTWQQFCDSQDK